MGRKAAARSVAASLVFVLAACGGPSASGLTSPAGSTGPGTTAAPSASGPVPSLAPSDGPSPIASSPGASPASEACAGLPADRPAAAAQLLPGSAVKVVVSELNLRKNPCTRAKRLATLEKGQVLLVWDQPYGPISSNGYTWYNVAIAPNSYAFGELPPLPASPFPDGTDTTSGWVAASEGDQPFLTPMAPRCPATVNLENVVGMLPAERLACLDGPIVLEGTFGCGGCGGAGGPVGKPAWLADTFEFQQIRVGWTGEFGNRPVGLHFRPTGPDAPREGLRIRATAHVDDPAAARCSFVWALEDPPFIVPDWYAQAWCRERLVVDSLEELGSDPDFPG